MTVTSKQLIWFKEENELVEMRTVEEVKINRGLNHNCLYRSQPTQTLNFSCTELWSQSLGQTNFTFHNFQSVSSHVCCSVVKVIKLTKQSTQHLTEQA